MELTFIGVIQLVIGSAIVIAGSLRAAIVFLLLSGLFNGSAALLLPALGGSSIPPIHFALLFVMLRILVPRGGYVGNLPDAFRANRWLGLFVAYGVVIAYIGPRLFGGDIAVYPMDYVEGGRFDTLPLKPTSQNITASLYLVGTLCLAMSAWIACRSPRNASAVVSSVIFIAWAHITLGILAFVVRGTPFDDIVELFRNSTYMQINTDVGGFVRIRGIFPEASSYASYAFAIFVINVELWYRAIRPQATGAAALGLATILFFSTSSSAYVGLACYLIFFFSRSALLPAASTSDKVKTVLVTIGFLGFITAILLAVIPSLPSAVARMILEMTFEKSASDSGAQRMFWAMQGWHGFIASYGIGLGPGSFRSSSIIMAILGAMGVIGITAFLFYLFTVFQPWRASTWGQGDYSDYSLGAAFSSAALLSLIPEVVSSANVVPDASFAIFAGAALALRPFGVMRFPSEVSTDGVDQMEAEPCDRGA